MREHRQPRKFEGNEWRTRRRGQFVCGVCGEVGHNARRHKDRPAPLVAKPMFLRGRPDVPHPLADGTVKPARHYREWTSADDVELELLWDKPEWGVNEIAIKLGRGRAAVCDRARATGLQTGCPHGYEYLTAAARRVGACNHRMLRQVLDWAGVKQWQAKTRIGGKKWRDHYVDPAAVDDAMARWCRAETIADGARRYGVSHTTLKIWLVAIGVTESGRGNRSKWRLDPETVDRAVNAAIARGHGRRLCNSSETSARKEAA